MFAKLPAKFSLALSCGWSSPTLTLGLAMWPALVNETIANVPQAETWNVFAYWGLSSFAAGTPSATMGKILASSLEIHSSVDVPFTWPPAPTTRVRPIEINLHIQLIAAIRVSPGKRSRIVNWVHTAHSVNFKLTNYCYFKPLNFGVFCYVAAGTTDTLPY